MEEQKIVLYSSFFSSLDEYLSNKLELENETLSVIKLERHDTIFEYIAEDPTLLIIDIYDSEIDDHLVYLNHYFKCPQIYIFETQEDMITNSDYLSRNQIYGFVKDSLLIEKIRELFIKLELIDGEIEFLTLENLEYHTDVNIHFQASEVRENEIIIAKPGITEISSSNDQQYTFFLKNFNYYENLSCESFNNNDDSDFAVNLDTAQILDQLKLFEFENSPRLSITLISDQEPDYLFFSSIGVVLNYYDDPNKCADANDIIIVKDKLINVNCSFGTEITKNELFNNKPILLLNRILPLSKYKHDLLESTTSKHDQDMIIRFIERNRIVKDDQIYYFDTHNNLMAGHLKTKVSIMSLNESFITLVCPLALEPSCKISLPFLGAGQLTVVHCEKFQNNFLIELHIDNFCEARQNQLRRVINKIYYFDENSIEWNFLNNIDEIENFQVQVAEEET